MYLILMWNYCPFPMLILNGNREINKTADFGSRVSETLVKILNDV